MARALSRRALLAGAGAAAFVAGLPYIRPAHAAEQIFGPGTHLLADPIVYAGGERFSVRGAGADRTTLIWTGEQDGIDITFTEMSRPPRIEGLTLLTRKTDQCAIRVRGPATPGLRFAKPRFADLDLAGENPAVQCWQRHLKLSDLWYPVIERVWAHGIDARGTPVQPPYAAKSFVEFERCQALTIDDVGAFYVEDAVKQLDAVLGEGQIITRFEFVGVRKGISLRSMGGTAISHGHINAWLCCIDLDGKLQLSIDHCLLFKFYLSQENWEGIRALNCDDLTIVNNGLYGTPIGGGTNSGVLLVNVKDSTIAGNKGGYFNANPGNFLIVIGTASTRNMVVDNMLKPVIVNGVPTLNGTPVFVGAAGNYVSNNK